MSSKEKPAKGVAERVLAETQSLRSLMEPVAALARRAQEPGDWSPLDMMIEIQRSTLAAVEQVRQSQERVVALLSQPVVERAVREVLKS